MPEKLTIIPMPQENRLLVNLDKSTLNTVEMLKALKKISATSSSVHYDCNQVS